MKAFYLLCFLSLSYLSNAQYSKFLLGVLRGADLVGESFTRYCKYEPEGSKPSGQIQPYWETLMTDLIDLSQNCRYLDALKVLTTFQSSKDLMDLTLTHLDEARNNNQIKQSSDSYEAGYAIGAFLEQYFRMVDPYAFRFVEDPTAYKDLGTAAYPVAIFHGLNQNCNDSTYVQFTSYLGKQLNTYTRCVEIGNGVATSFLMSMTDQAKEACQKVKADPNFANGLNVVGLSQGGLIARSLLQNCDGLKIHVVNTVGTPNNGVTSIPNCFVGFTCKIFNDALELGVYRPVVQGMGPAGYYKDQYNYDTFLQSSSFLAEFNNEKSINQEYIEDYQTLDWLVLLKFTQDEIVDPPESEWFGYYALNSQTLLPWNETLDYTNNLLGFKDLDAQGKIVRLSLNSGHLDFTQQEYTEMVVPYLL
ncbi:unnamed protein product [Blepharisma stoltei]|uniref:Uncharacterized protein n=1 Tax=Blepharisma stoltei TaxID=1481888 RepID=A0AAU9ITG5_9CILI|nr:unnamed protein product [Blepharisma stoltei]